MLSVGDIHIFVSDFPLALRFWRDGLGLNVVEQQSATASPFAVLEMPDGGPAIRLFGGVKPWREDERPPVGERPTVRFDIATSDFDGTFSSLLDCGGLQLDPVEEYEGYRVVTVADPDGNSFELVEIPGE